MPGPVTNWSNRFDIGDDLDWDTEPGQLKLIIVQGEHVVDSSVPAAYSCYLYDVDLDGDNDVVGCSYSANTVSWWNNVDEGDLFVEYPVGTCSNPVAVVAGDLDGDNDRDIVVSAAGVDQLIWFENQTNGSNWVSHVLESSFDARQVRLSDFDGDGDLDILAVSSSTGDVCWWRNRLAQGLPWLKNYIDGSLLGAYACDAADVDMDGDKDVVASTTTADDIFIYLNDLQFTGSWIKETVDDNESDPYSVILANIDADPRPEIVCASGWGLGWYDYLTTQADWYEHALDNSVPYATSVAAADFDADEDLDLTLCTWSGNDVFWYQNLTAGESWERSLVDDNFGGPQCIVTGDMDGDNVPDIGGAAQTENRISWWRIAGFSSPGYLVSSIYDTQSQNTIWQQIFFSLTQPPQTYVSFRLRASDDPANMGPWSSPITTPGASLVGVLENGDRYVQYEVTLVTANPYVTPSLKDVAIWFTETGVEGSDPVLSLTSPNPCVGSFTLDWSLPAAAQVTLEVYDMAGRIARTVEDGWFAEGLHTSVVDGMPSGVYTAVLRGEGFSAQQRVVLLD